MGGLGVEPNQDIRLTGKSERRTRPVPQRTCVGCRKVLAKRQLIRLVRRPEGVVIDQTGKLAGRGAYLHNQRSCWERGLQGSLAHALKINLTGQDVEHLHDFMQHMPETPDQEKDQIVSPGGLARK